MPYLSIQCGENDYCQNYGNDGVDEVPLPYKVFSYNNLVMLVLVAGSLLYILVLVTISKMKVVPSTLARLTLRETMKHLTAAVGCTIANTAAIKNMTRLSNESSTVSARGQWPEVVMSFWGLINLLAFDQ